MDTQIKPSFTPISIIGPAIIDVVVGPVNPTVFTSGSEPIDFSKLSFGGDALNEAVALSKLGENVELLSIIGNDNAGKNILSFLNEMNVKTDKITISPLYETGMNIVLVDSKGERYFLTQPNSSLRKLSEFEILPYVDSLGDIVSFASIFISSSIDIKSMKRIFSAIKRKKNRILITDMTRAKNGESLNDLRCLFPFIDYFFSNEKELFMITKEKDYIKGLEQLIQNGISCAILKLGSKGSIIRTIDNTIFIPPYPVSSVVDTTGAGDCYVAGFINAISQKLPLHECGLLASAIASCSIEAPGATDGLNNKKICIERFAALKMQYSNRLIPEEEEKNGKARE